MSRVKVHTVEQPDSDTTAFILSCNRLDVLDKTIQSFLSTRDYNTKMVIVDDSGEDVFDVLKMKYGSFADIYCWPKNRGQWWAMDAMVSLCDTEYIFYLEDDWELLQPGYLGKSKTILESHRDIGVIDISWRTFENQGIDSYEKELIDGSFYYKKPWQITPYHLVWCSWCGGPNLRRRDDLILLGRVEKWHNEWNIDRKFTALGFKGAFLDGEYARHLGDNCSKMASKRPPEHTTPEDYYPKELLPNRIIPKWDWSFADRGRLQHPHDITLVTALVDIGRDGRSFEDHYMKSLERVLQTRHPIVVYCEEKYRDRLIATRGNAGPLYFHPFDKKSIEVFGYWDRIQKITQTEEWKNQAPWMKDSVICNPYYAPLMLMKHELLNYSMQFTTSDRFYWIDAGIYNSFPAAENINDFYFCKIPIDKFFIASWPYSSDTEMHGFAAKGFEEISGRKMEYVCRDTFYGGTRKQIEYINPFFYRLLSGSLDAGYCGIAESNYSLLSMIRPEFFHRYQMPNGDINNFLRTIKL